MLRMPIGSFYARCIFKKIQQPGVCCLRCRSRVCDLGTLTQRNSMRFHGDVNRTPWTPRALPGLNPSCSPLARGSHSGGLHGCAIGSCPFDLSQGDARDRPASTSIEPDGTTIDPILVRLCSGPSSIAIRLPEVSLKQDNGWLDCEREFFS